MKTAKKGSRKDQKGDAKGAVPPAKTSESVAETCADTAAAGQALGSSDGAAETEDPPREVVLEQRLLRLQADFDNYRKRTLREREALYRRANEDIMFELLPVLDHLELAFQAAGNDGAEHSLVKGFALVGEQLQQVLRKFGLTEIETDGVDFDPNVHEAIQHVPSEEVPEGGLIARTRAGYMFGNRLLRAAQVVVSSGPLGDAAES